jgi:hypothetical protein
MCVLVKFIFNLENVQFYRQKFLINNLLRYILFTYGNHLYDRITTIREEFCVHEISLSSGAGTAYPFGAPELTPGFSGIPVTRS